MSPRMIDVERSTDIYMRKENVIRTTDNISIGDEVVEKVEAKNKKVTEWHHKRKDRRQHSYRLEDCTKSYPSRSREADRQSHHREGPQYYFGMNIPLPKGFKPPTDIEPYEGTINSQEYLDAFRSRMT